MAYDETTAQLLRENEKLRAACADLMSVRDQFAMASMTGCLPGSRVDPDEHARWAYRMADAMVRARNGGVTESDLPPLPSPDLAAILHEAATNPHYQRAEYVRWMMEASEALHAITKWAEGRAAAGVNAPRGGERDA